MIRRLRTGFRKVDQYLLVHHPNLWSSRLHLLIALLPFAVATSWAVGWLVAVEAGGRVPTETEWGSWFWLAGALLTGAWIVWLAGRQHPLPSREGVEGWTAPVGYAVGVALMLACPLAATDGLRRHLEKAFPYEDFATLFAIELRGFAQEGLPTPRSIQTLDSSFVDSWLNAVRRHPGDGEPPLMQAEGLYHLLAIEEVDVGRKVFAEALPAPAPEDNRAEESSVVTAAFELAVDSVRAVRARLAPARSAVETWWLATTGDSLGLSMPSLPATVGLVSLEEAEGSFDDFLVFESIYGARRLFLWLQEVSEAYERVRANSQGNVLESDALLLVSLLCGTLLHAVAEARSLTVPAPWGIFALLVVASALGLSAYVGNAGVADPELVWLAYMWAVVVLAGWAIRTGKWIGSRGLTIVILWTHLPLALVCSVSRVPGGLGDFGGLEPRAILARAAAIVVVIAVLPLLQRATNSVMVRPA
mgnify:CR=1 FL=1